jgi:hypothetical protein
MQIAIVSRPGAEELADKLYRAVVTEELGRMKTKYDRQVAALTEAHRMTEKRLSNMYTRELRRISKCLYGNWPQRMIDKLIDAWAVFFALLLEFGFVEYIPDEEDE